MVTLRRLKHKAKLIGCDVKKVDSCDDKPAVEKLMKVVDDKLKAKLTNDSDKEKIMEVDVDGSSE